MEVTDQVVAAVQVVLLVRLEVVVPATVQAELAVQVEVTDQVVAAVQVETVEVVEQVDQVVLAEVQAEAVFLIPDLFQVQVELVLEYLLMRRII